MEDNDIIKVGSAEEIITPGELIPFGEYKYLPKAKGKKDDIFVRALYLESSKEKSLIVVCDVMGLYKDFVDRIRKKIEEYLQIPANNIMIVAVQNHSAPQTLWYEEGKTLPEGKLKEWFLFFEKQICKSALKAKENSTESFFSFGEGKVETIGANRRPISKSGRVIMTWYRPKEEDIIDWGIYDPSVKVIKITDIKSNLTTVLFHYSCHPNVLWATGLYSSDFPGRAGEIVKMVYGEKVIPIFLNGFCGDIDPFKNMRVPIEAFCAPEVFGPSSKVEMCIPESERFGNILGGEIVKVVSEANNPISFHTLKIVSTYIKVPLANWKLFNDRAEEMEIQIIAIDNFMAFIGVPGEPFLTLELELEKKSPYLWTIPLGHANGYYGYIPDKNSYDKGGYGVGESQTNLSPGGGEKIIEEIIHILKNIYLKTA